MIDGIRNLSLGELLSKLHSAILDFVETIDETIEHDRGVSASDIRQLRDHIASKIEKKEDVADNQKLLKVLDLFATNSAVIELVREDAEDWLRFLDSIEKGIEQKGGTTELKKEEIKEINDIRELTSQIRELIRK